MTGLTLTVGERQYSQIDRSTDAQLAAMPDFDCVVALAVVDELAVRLRRRARPSSGLPSGPFFEREDLER